MTWTGVEWDRLVPPHEAQVTPHSACGTSPCRLAWATVPSSARNSPRIRRRGPKPPAVHTAPTSTPVPAFAPISPRAEPVATCCGGAAWGVAVGARAVAGVVFEEGGARVALVEGGGTESAGGQSGKRRTMSE